MVSFIAELVRAPYPKLWLAFSDHKFILELKELIAMHSSNATHGGDLKADTVNIIGAALDLQEKVVKQVRNRRCPTCGVFHNDL